MTSHAENNKLVFGIKSGLTCWDYFEQFSYSFLAQSWVNLKDLRFFQVIFTTLQMILKKTWNNFRRFLNIS